MNIFFIEPTPEACARSHNNKHTIKQLLETAQLLCTAHRVLDGTLVDKKWRLTGDADAFLYKATHINHPSNKWIRETTGNYTWASDLLVALCKEYTYRYGKIHKCQEIGLVDWLADNFPQNIKQGPTTEFAVAISDEWSIDAPPLENYRNYYQTAKLRMADWTGKVGSREKPSWFTKEIVIS
jgi:hypothetical protein